jgi:Txe/YoeB family toxin of Txe-Axe toxin-antitoxin module
MDTKIFKTINDFKLIIKNSKSAVIFEIDKSKESKDYKFSFQFTSEVFNELLKYVEMIANKAWANLMPKEAISMSSDYNEYYDRKLDNNGYLAIGENILLIERPSLDSERIYQFNKRKMESFIYDFRKMVTS